MRMRKLRGPNKKMSMPFEPFRTHTQPVNLDDLEARFDKGASVDLDALRGAGLATRKGIPVKVLGARRAHQAADRARPRLLEVRPREDRVRGRHLPDHRVVRQGERRRARHHPQLVQGPGDPEEAGLHGGDPRALPARLLHPGAGRQHRGAASRSRTTTPGRTSSASSTSSPAAGCPGWRCSRSGSCPTSPPRSSCSCSRWSRRRSRSCPRKARSGRPRSRSTRAT